MATQEDVRRIAQSLPGTHGDGDGNAFRVDGRLFVWAWLQRIEPKKRRVPSNEVVAVRVANEAAKQDLLALDPDVFFTEPHYDGYPAVLVRLAAIDDALLDKVLTDAWKTRASTAQRARAREEGGD